MMEFTLTGIKGFLLGLLTCYVFIGIFIGMASSSFVNQRLRRSVLWWVKYWFFMATVWPVFLRVRGW
jgi:hypothetical protein